MILNEILSFIFPTAAAFAGGGITYFFTRKLYVQQIEELKSKVRGNEAANEGVIRETYKQMMSDIREEFTRKLEGERTDCDLKMTILREEMNLNFEKQGFEYAKQIQELNNKIEYLAKN
jgi:hypothetical protein